MLHVFGRSMLKSEYDTVLRMFGDLRWAWARFESKAWAWNLSTEYWIRFYNLGPRKRQTATGDGVAIMQKANIKMTSKSSGKAKTFENICQKERSSRCASFSVHIKIFFSNMLSNRRVHWFWLIFSSTMRTHSTLTLQASMIFFRTTLSASMCPDPHTRVGTHYIWL